MQGRVYSLSLTFIIFLLLSLTERPLKAESSFPGDILTALEIKKQVEGKTAEVFFIKNKEKGLFFFNPKGEFQQLINNWLENGNWQVKGDDQLCIRIAGESRKCRMLVRDKDGVGQFIVKKDGKHQRELTYENFIAGNKLLELTKSSSPPLEILNKKEIILLFSDKTVESETVRRGRLSMTYYHPDGTLDLLRNGKEYSGAWRVTDKDRMCLNIENSQEKCRIIVKQGSSFSKYIVKKNGKHQQSISYRRFRPGKQF
jgi:hypothetical protein